MGGSLRGARFKISYTVESSAIPEPAAGGFLEAWIKIFLGLLFLFLSLAYLYRPAWVLTLNVLGRAFLFNDTYVLLYRRTLGLLLFAAAGLFLYSGLNNLAYQKPSVSVELWDAYRVFRGQEYQAVVSRCEEILAKDPENQYAWSLLGSAWSALGEKEKAARVWEQGMQRAARARRTQEVSPEGQGFSHR